MKAYYDRQDAYFRERFKIVSGIPLRDAIHDMRVVLKRMRAFFRLVESIDPGFAAEKSFRPARKLFRAAGKIRNRQVVEERIHGLMKETGIELSEFFNDLKIGEWADAKRFDRVCRKFDAGFFGIVWKSIGKSPAGLSSPRIREGTEARLTGLLREIRESGDQVHSIACLHLLRIKSKEARYVLEILEAGPDDGREPSELNLRLKAVHQSLGKWRDDDVILQRLAAFRKDAASRPYFSDPSYRNFARILRESRRRNLEEFEKVWTAFRSFPEADRDKTSAR